MKSILFSLVLMVVGVAQAQLNKDIRPETLTYYNVYNCTGWMFSGNGYVCSGYPMSVQVPDAYSTSDNFKALDARIKALEAKVQLLEAKLQK
jgi:hypothetical protein